MWRKWKLERWRENLAIAIARRLPKRVRYWAFIQTAVTGNNSYPGEQTVMEVMKRHESWAQGR
jgi:hypothetical protein